MKEKSKIKVIGSNEECATEGKFRSVVMLDSEVYQIGEDADSLNAAYDLCHEHDGNLVQIFNDKGEPQIPTKF